MTLEEFAEIIDIEGLEYYLCYKNNDWHYLDNPEILEQCHKLVEASNEINRLLKMHI